MANAIKKISVQRGIDVTQLHAVLLRRRRRRSTPARWPTSWASAGSSSTPTPRVLSAYGMGLADVRVLRQRRSSGRSTTALTAELEAAVADARRRGRARSCAPRTCPTTASRTEARVHVRYAGTDTSLEVPLADAAAPARRLRGRAPLALRLHRRGPRPGGRGGHGRGHRRHGGGGRARAAGRAARDAARAGADARPSSPPARRTSRPSASRPPVFTREALLPGRPDRRPGAGLRRHHHRRGRARLGAGGDAARPPRSWTGSSRCRAQVAVGTHCDPILLEIFNNLFMTIAEQMGVTLQSTAYSVNVKERLDFSCAVFDADGALVANAPHMPVHLGSMGESVRTILRAATATSCGRATSRRSTTPTMAAPTCPTSPSSCRCSRGGELVFFTAAARASRRHRRHHAGLDAARQHAHRPGGRAVRQLPPGRARPAARGGAARAAARPAPTRSATQTQNVADLQAQIAACQRGANELAKMVGQFGLDTVRAYMGHVQDNAEESVRRVLDVLQDGEFTYAARRRPGGPGQDHDRQGRPAGPWSTSPAPAPQQPWNFNAPGGRHPGRRALRLPHPGRRRHPDERGLPEADRHRPARGLDRLPAATRPRSAPAMSRPRNGSPTRSTVRWACWRRPRAR